MSKPFRANEEDWKNLEVAATDPSGDESRAILELRSRIEALEAAEPAQSAPEQQAAAAESESQPEADQPAAEPPFKPGQLWKLRNGQIVVVESVGAYLNSPLLINFIYVDAHDLRRYVSTYEASGRNASGDTERDFIELISSPK